MISTYLEDDSAAVCAGEAAGHTSEYKLLNASAQCTTDYIPSSATGFSTVQLLWTVLQMLQYNLITSWSYSCP